MSFKERTIICFIRHGQTDWNLQSRMQGREEVPLNETGINQAKEASSALSKTKDSFGWSKIITSPLSRAKDTANMIKEATECPSIIVDERLLERDFGALSGTEYNSFSKAVCGNVPELSTVETVESLLGRVNELIEEKVSEGEHVLFVTHGAVTRVFADNAKRSSTCPDIKGLSIGNCHMAIYSYDNRELLLEGYNVSCEELSEFLEEK
jgi:probable phosphoglycerate mutase/uncharacterized phosphatase